MSHIVDGVPEVGAELGLIRMTIAYKKGNQEVHARDWLLTPHQALKVAGELQRHALLMAGTKVVPMKKPRRAHGP